MSNDRLREMTGVPAVEVGHGKNGKTRSQNAREIEVLFFLSGGYAASSNSSQSLRYGGHVTLRINRRLGGVLVF